MTSVNTSRIEINLNQLRKNLEILQKDMSRNLKWTSVLKDQAYGHGAVKIAKETLAAGASNIAVSTLDEALELKTVYPKTSFLIFGERPSNELESCVENDFVFFVNDQFQAKAVSEIGKKHGKKINVQIEVDTGLSRYGVRWNKALSVIENILSMSNLKLVGVMTHLAMSDELDKTFANTQLSRFEECISQIKKISNQSILFHACNSGGYLDLPKAHYDLVRVGILPLGVYPSQVCRRIEGVQPIMSVKTNVATIKKMEIGDVAGYGMHYRAETPRTIAVLPMGYGTGYPRLRNKGHVLIHGKRTPIVGGNSMDAIMIDITNIPETKTWDEVVILGRQGNDEISVHDLAGWNGTVSYDIMTRWNNKLPRVYTGH